jgi:hypothetical protein
MTSTLPPHSSHTSPTLPRNHVGWTEAIVKWTRGEYVDLWMYPSHEGNETLMKVYKGDMIQVSPKHRKEEWCLAQVGHVMGWLNTQNVKLLVQNQAPVIERPSYTGYAPNATTSVNPAVQAMEEDTQPALPPQSKAAEPAKKAMLQKLISFFKK